MCYHWPEFATGGVTFFTNLASNDPYLRFPILTGVVSLLMFETQPMVKPRSNAMKWGFRGLALIIVYISTNFPNGLTLYWIVSGLFAALSSLIFRYPRIRIYFGLKPLGLDQYKKEFNKFYNNKRKI